MYIWRSALELTVIHSEQLPIQLHVYLVVSFRVNSNTLRIIVSSATCTSGGQL